MEKIEWIKTKLNMDSVDWNGNPIHLVDVPALKNSRTGKVRIYPSDVAQAEFRMRAKKYNLEPRDIALLSLLYAKPGPFQEGQVHFKYHLNKMLFYQWKEMGELGLDEAYPHDEFEAFPRGPVPKNIDQDLERLNSLGLITQIYVQWGKGDKDASMKTELTEKSNAIIEEIWKESPDLFKEATLKVKEQIFPLDPKTVQKRVHRDYPEYQKTYIKIDTD